MLMFISRLSCAGRAAYRFALLTRKRGVEPAEIPAFSGTLRQPRKKPTDQLTEAEINDFDRHYQKRRRIEQVNLNSSKPLMRVRYEKQDVTQLLGNKIKDLTQLLTFIRSRRSQMRPLEVKFCLDMLYRLEAEIDQQVVAILEDALLATDAIPASYCKLFIEFAINNEPQNQQLLNKLTVTYLKDVAAHEDGLLDIDTVVDLPESVTNSVKKIIIRLSKRSLSTGLAMLRHFADSLTEEQSKNYDQWLSKQFESLSLKQKLAALEVFGRSGRKGLFVELMKTCLLNNQLPAATLAEVLKISIQLTLLNELYEVSFEQLEPLLVGFLQHQAFTPGDLKLVIQLAHRSCAGGLEFWRLLHRLYTESSYSEMFAILGGYERNHHTDAKLFTDMIVLDAKMEALNLENENDFLKLMLVYRRNIAAIPESYPHKQVVVEKIKAKLMQLHKTRPYKTFSMLFLWLLESNPAKKQEYLKLVYRQPDEAELFEIMENPAATNETSRQLQRYLDYYSLDPVRAALEIFIRRRKAQFEKRK